MSKYPSGEGKTKSSKKLSIGRNRSPKSADERTQYGVYLNDNIPDPCRKKLRELFSQIEKEFEKVYVENQSLQEKVDFLTEKLENTGNIETPEKPGADGADGATSATKASVGKKTSAGKLMSKKIKTTYKASTSKFVSSFKTPGQAQSIECHYIQKYEGHKDGVWEVSTSNNIPTVLGSASADHCARLWCIESGQCHLKYAGHLGSVNSIKFHPNEPLVCTGSGDESSHIWRLPVTIYEQFSKNKSGSPSGSSPDWSHDENDATDEELEDGACDSADGHRPFVLKTPSTMLKAHKGAVMAVDWLPDGKRVVTASWDNTAKLWDAEQSTVIQTLTGHDEELTHICSHRSQDLIVTASYDSTFRLWDFRTPSLHSVSVFQGHTNTVTSAVFTDQDIVVSGSDDRTVKVWDLKNMRAPLTTIRLDSAINRLSVSCDQNVIAIPHDNRHVHLLDLSGFRLMHLPRRRRYSHRRMVSSVAWGGEISGKGCNLFTAGFDRKVLGWHIIFSCKENVSHGKP